jgi:hypothetical protein
VFTVDDLFGVAQGASVNEFSPHRPEECLKRITFDATYGFPNAIAFDCPDVYDDQHSVEVVAFEPFSGYTETK